MASLVKTAVVIDNGSGMCKAGFGGDQTPKVVFPTIVGRSKNVDDASSYVGNGAQNKLENLNISHPIVRGVVTNWDDMEKIWHHTFYNELKISPSEQKVLLTESPLTVKQNHEKMKEIMFEKFEVPAMHVTMQAVLALYASGNLTGTVVDSGDGVTHVVPVFEGYGLPHAIMPLNIAGSDLTVQLQKMIKERTQESLSSECSRDLKENSCYVAVDYEKELANYKSSQEIYTLRDGKTITIGSERFVCPEVMFHPSFCGLKCEGIHDVTHNCIMKCDLDIRKSLTANVILAGGNTMFNGFADRMEKELGNLSKSEVKIVAPSQRDYSVWIGGSILASLPAAENTKITKKEYEESGASVVHSKEF